MRFRNLHGGTRWRELEGVAIEELPDGSANCAGVRWDEAHGIGRGGMKIKRLFE